jgi:hypothetical protein
MNTRLTLSNRLNRILAAVLLMAALATGQSVWATSTWTVTNDGNVFTISRSESGTAETVKYHTVSLSALAGKHFTAVSGTLEFAASETSKTVNVTETAKDDVNILYRIQTVMSRSYRMEVTNTNGYLLAYRDRIIEFGDDYRYKTRYLNNSLENLVIFNQNGEFSTLNENDIVSFLMNKVNKYIDVYYDPSTNTNHVMSGDYIKIDDGYDYNDKTLCTIPTAKVFGETAANVPLQSYLDDIGVRLYATVCFTMKEENDGYQYIQILVDKPVAHDGKDPDGKVKKPSESVYKACFEMSKGTGAVTDDHKMFFPHLYDSSTPAHHEFEYADGYLWSQLFKSDDYKAPGNGALRLDPRVRDINVRFDANGKNEDTWCLKDLFVRLALLDAKRPEIIANDVTISAAAYNRGNTVYISVPFTEIVNVVGSPAISTTWGTLRYVAGSGTNVLTFAGVIDAVAGTKLQITGLSGGVEDPAGNAFTDTKYRSKVFDEYVSTEISTPVGTPYLTFNGFAITSGYSSGGDGPEDEFPMLVDGTTTTRWLVEDGMGPFTTVYVEFTYGSPIVPKGYILTTGNSVSGHPNRNPRSWVLKGRINSSDPWTEIAAVNDGALPNTDRTDVRYLVDNTKGYQYFRFEVSAVGEKEGEYYKMELSELQLLGTFETDVAHNLANSTISGLDAYYEHTGAVIPISYTVTALDGTVLEKGTDYTEVITLKNGSDAVTVKDVGDYTLHIDGMAPYSGTQTADFTVSAATAVTAETTSLSSGVYEVTGDVTVTSRIIVNGTVTLGLRSGGKLTAEKGIQVGEGAKLIINGPGTLIANAESNNAGIGATYANDYSKYGDIVINGGTITANGGYYAAGIGGGRDSWNGWSDPNNHTPSITINGGTVTAYGGVYAAGIGGGCNACNSYYCGLPGDITINGGQVTAWSHGDGGGIGIGKGYNASGSGGALVIGWTNSANDYVDVSRYNMDYISFASGKEFLIADVNIMANTSNITSGCKIIPKTAVMDNNLAYATVSGIEETYHYTGNEIALNYTVTDIYSKTLTKGTDYTETVSPSPVNAAGNYTLTLNGAGSYDGTQQTICFKVVYSAPTGFHQTAYTDNSATVGWEGSAAEYDVQYSADQTFATSTQITVNTNSAEITGLTPLDTYYARVRIAAGDLGEWSEPIVVFATDRKWVGVGAAVKGTSMNLPLNSSYAYCLTQQIYTHAEIGQQGTISSISFCNQSEWDEFREPVNIYMVHTDKTAFDNDNDWICVTSADLVFNGKIAFTPWGWTTIELSKPFIHDTDQNIALIIQDNDGGCYYGNLVFSSYEGVGNNTLYRRQDNEEMDPTNPTVTGTRTSSKSQVLLRFNPVITLANNVDNTSVIEQYDGEQVDVTLADHTLCKDGAWNTICLPFDLNISGSILDGDNVDVRTLDNSDFDSSTGVLTLDFTNKGEVTSIQAGVPYIIKWSKTNDSDPDLTNLVAPTFRGVQIDNSVSNVNFTHIQFIGTYAPISFTSDDNTKFFVGADNKLHYPLAGASIGACRAYFQLNGLTVGGTNSNAPVQNIVLNLDNDATGIVEMRNEWNEGNERNVNDEMRNAAMWFTLDGRKLDAKPTEKGVYIQGNKKVVIK